MIRLCERVSCGSTPFRVIMKQWILAKFFMRQGILLGNFLCDRVQGVERFATHPRHFPCQVPPPRDIPLINAEEIQSESGKYFDV